MAESVKLAKAHAELEVSLGIVFNHKTSVLTPSQQLGIHRPFSNYDSVPNQWKTSSNRERESVLSEQQLCISKQAVGFQGI